ncbi:hypothetical protein L5515_000003 [Caenorhabditis briggsae]|uniref:Uncharacterized protein n=1 Tax=Caenorhabditis briggsae TaxID=6238 RepID=A0AAE9J1N2_CAEBR|nr:hypothetical protein L5515_000003 [Caenorhabditis briggsae]
MPKRVSTTPVKAICLSSCDEDEEVNDITPEKNMRIASSGAVSTANDSDGRTMDTQEKGPTSADPPSTTTGVITHSLLARRLHPLRQKLGISVTKLKDTPKPKLSGLTKMRKRAVEIFMKAFRGSLKLRSESSNSGFDASCLPNVDDFMKYFVGVMSSQSCGLISQMRISHISRETLRKSAASALYFYTFLNTTNVIRVESTDEDSLFEKIEKSLSAMTYEDKAQLIGRFVMWYEEIPPVRLTTMKILASDGDERRQLFKENSTMNTVVRGLLCYLTFVGVVKASSCKAPTEESRRIWLTVKSVFRTCAKRKGGCLDFSRSPLAFEDLMKMTDRLSNVKTTFHLQSLLLALFLSGTGLRIGSIRNKWSQGLEKTGVVGGVDDDEGESGDSEDDFSDLENEGSEGSEEYTCFEFDTLLGQNVRVYRQGKRESDIEGTVRIRVEVDVMSSKTTGYSAFTPTVIGFSYPSTLPDGTTDRSINTAIVVAMLSVIIGCTEAKKIYHVDYEPESGTEIEISCNTGAAGRCPLFRAGNRYYNLSHSPLRNVSSSLSYIADALKIPSMIFTSRSYRSGYAKSLIASVVMDESGTQIVTLDHFRNVLNTSARWRSNQVDRYISSITKNVLVRGMSVGTTTTSDWLSAVFSTDAYTKKYDHVSSESLCEYIAKDQQISLEEVQTQLKELGRHKRRNLLDAINLTNWRNSTDECRSLEESKRAWFHRETLNIQKTFDDLHEFVYQNLDTFQGNGKINTATPTVIVCPVSECEKSCETIPESNEHWAKEHHSHVHSLKYLCRMCPYPQLSKYKGYRYHMGYRHAAQKSVWKWTNESS